jgi:PPP family 3-phenylpropionic acid transporter
MRHLHLEHGARDLWLTRLYYFFFLGGSGFIVPFLNLFYLRVGLSGTDIGVVAAIGSAVALLAAPVWTTQIRRWAHPRSMLQVSLLLTALVYLWLGSQTLFLGITLVTVVRFLVGSGIAPLSDSVALSVTGSTRSGFGSVRVWGSLGWIITVLMSGWLIEQTGFGAAFGGICLVTLCGALLLFRIEPSHFVSSRKAGPQAEGVKAVLHDLLDNRAMVGVGLMLTIIGLANSGVAQFETIYLSTLGARDSLLGVAGMASALVEVPCMFWADRLVRRRGAHPVLLSAMWMTALVRGLVFLSPSIVTIMAERAIGGIAFSFYIVALTGFIGEQTRPGQTGTVLALYTVTLANLIGIVSAPLAGAAYDAFGARWLYAVALAGYGLGWLVLRFTRARQPETIAPIPRTVY